MALYTLCCDNAQNKFAFGESPCSSIETLGFCRPQMGQLYLPCRLHEKRVFTKTQDFHCLISSQENPHRKLNEHLLSLLPWVQVTATCVASYANVSSELYKELRVASVTCLLARRMDWSAAWKSLCNSFHICVTARRPVWPTLLAEATVLRKLLIPLLNRVFRSNVLSKSWCIFFCTIVTVLIALYQKQQRFFCEE
jgi:hypothetical protein